MNTSSLSTNDLNKRTNKPKQTLGVVKLPKNNITSRHLPKIDEESENKVNQSQTKQLKAKNLLLSIEFNNKLNPYSNSDNRVFDKAEQEQLVNPQYVTEYSHEINEHLKLTEAVNIPNYPNILNNQKKINEKIRMTLINWLANIHFKFELQPETLYLAINILDQYTEKQSIELSQYQLVGVACMLIACKYEEIYAPEIRDFIHLSKYIYSKEQILIIESRILSKLEFEILAISSYSFLRRYYFISNDKSVQTFHLAQFILELSMIDLNIMKYSQSTRACTALYMARKLLKYETVWIPVLKLQSGYTDKDLKPCLKETVSLLQIILKNKDNPIIDKFKTHEYSRIAALFDEVNA